MDVHPELWVFHVVQPLPRPREKLVYHGWILRAQVFGFAGVVVHSLKQTASHRLPGLSACGVPSKTFPFWTSFQLPLRTASWPPEGQKMAS